MADEGFTIDIKANFDAVLEAMEALKKRVAEITKQFPEMKEVYSSSSLDRSIARAKEIIELLPQINDPTKTKEALGVLTQVCEMQAAQIEKVGTALKENDRKLLDDLKQTGIVVKDTFSPAIGTAFIGNAAEVIDLVENLLGELNAIRIAMFDVEETAQNAKPKLQEAFNVPALDDLLKKANELGMALNAGDFSKVEANYDRLDQALADNMAEREKVAEQEKALDERANQTRTEEQKKKDEIERAGLEKTKTHLEAEKKLLDQQLDILDALAPAIQRVSQGGSPILAPNGPGAAVKLTEEAAANAEQEREIRKAQIYGVMGSTFHKKRYTAKANEILSTLQGTDEDDAATTSARKSKTAATQADTAATEQNTSAQNENQRALADMRAAIEEYIDYCKLMGKRYTALDDAAKLDTITQAQAKMREMGEEVAKLGETDKAAYFADTLTDTVNGAFDAAAVKSKNFNELFTGVSDTLDQIGEEIAKTGNSLGAVTNTNVKSLSELIKQGKELGLALRPDSSLAELDDEYKKLDAERAENIKQYRNLMDAEKAAAREVTEAKTEEGRKQAQVEEASLAEIRKNINERRKLLQQRGKVLDDFSGIKDSWSGNRSDLENYNARITTGDTAEIKRNTIAKQENRAATLAVGDAIRASIGVDLARWVRIQTESLIDMGRAWSDLESRADAASDGITGNVEIMERLKGVADRSGLSINQVAESFLNSSKALSDLGISTDKQLQIQESLSNTFRATGVSGARLQSVMGAVNFAMTTGTISTRQMTALLRSGSVVTKAFADYVGVSVGELQEMAKQGKLTGEMLANSIIAKMDVWAKQAADTPGTVSAQWNKLRNDLMQCAGEMWKTFDGSQNAVAAIDFVREHIDSLVQAAPYVTAAFSSMLLGQTNIFRRLNDGVMAMGTAFSAIPARASAAAKAVNVLKIAGQGLMGIFGGPLGLALAGVSAATVFYATRESEASKFAKELGTDLETLRSKYDDLGAAADKTGAKLVPNDKHVLELKIKNNKEEQSRAIREYEDSLNNLQKSTARAAEEMKTELGNIKTVGIGINSEELAEFSKQIDEINKRAAENAPLDELQELIKGVTGRVKDAIDVAKRTNKEDYQSILEKLNKSLRLFQDHLDGAKKGSDDYNRAIEESTRLNTVSAFALEKYEKASKEAAEGDRYLADAEKSKANEQKKALETVISWSDKNTKSQNEETIALAKVEIKAMAAAAAHYKKAAAAADEAGETDKATEANRKYFEMRGLVEQAQKDFEEGVKHPPKGDDSKGPGGGKSKDELAKERADAQREVQRTIAELEGDVATLNRIDAETSLDNFCEQMKKAGIAGKEYQENVQKFQELYKKKVDTENLQEQLQFYEDLKDIIPEAGEEYEKLREQIIGVEAASWRAIIPEKEWVEIWEKFKKKKEIAPDDVFGSITKTLEDMINEMSPANEAAEMTRTSVDALTESITDFIKGSKSATDAFNSFAQNFCNALMKMAIEAMVVQPILRALKAAIESLTGGGSVMGGGGGVSKPIALPGGGVMKMHTGGVVGQDGTPTYALPSIFAGAERFHIGGWAGLKAGEVPIIAQKGERVLTRSQAIDYDIALQDKARAGAQAVNITTAPPNVAINFINQSGQNLTAEKGQMKSDGQGGYSMDMIVKMMDKQQATMVSTKQSAMARAMAQRYGGKSHEAQAAIRRA